MDTKLSISQQFTLGKWDELLTTLNASLSPDASVGMWLADRLKALLLRRPGRGGLENWRNSSGNLSRLSGLNHMAQEEKLMALDFFVLGKRGLRDALAAESTA